MALAQQARRPNSAPQQASTPLPIKEPFKFDGQRSLKAKIQTRQIGYIPAPRRGAERLRREQPARTAAHIAEPFAADDMVVSARTLQCHFVRVGLHRKAPTRRAFGRFEATAPNEIWTGDAMHGVRASDGGSRSSRAWEAASSWSLGFLTATQCRSTVANNVRSTRTQVACGAAKRSNARGDRRVCLVAVSIPWADGVVDAPARGRRWG